jgi:8-oxo-dGTP diphosphatase
MQKSWLKKAAGIIFTDGKSILLMKRNDGNHVNTWGIPGGKAKEGETEIGNAVRETKEETGLKSIPGQRFDSTERKTGNFKYTTFFYRVSKPFKIKLNKEHSEYKWVPFSELSTINLHPKLKKELEASLHKIQKKVYSFAEWACIQDFCKKF